MFLSVLFLSICTFFLSGVAFNFERASLSSPDASNFVKTRARNTYSSFVFLFFFVLLLSSHVSFYLLLFSFDSTSFDIVSMTIYTYTVEESRKKKQKKKKEKVSKYKVERKIALSNLLYTSISFFAHRNVISFNCTIHSSTQLYIKQYNY